MPEGPIKKLKRRIAELEAELLRVEAERDALQEQLDSLQEWRADQHSISRKFCEDFGGEHHTPIEDIPDLTSEAAGESEEDRS